MLKVGLTGNYMSGLDEVSEIYKNWGIPVFEADLIIKFLLFNNSETIIKVKNQFTSTVFTQNKLDLSKFAPNEFKRLLKVVELDLIKAYEKWRIEHSNYVYTLFKSQILFESSWNQLMNYNITIFRPNSLRAADIQEEHKMRATDAYNMIDNEMDSFQKNNLANYVIHNYDTYSDTIENQIAQINKLLYSKSNKEKV